MYSSYTPKYYDSYKAPSRNANTYESNHNRSRVNIDEICEETWPLDEVIQKVDIKSDSEDDFNYSKNLQSWSSGPQVISENFNSRKDVHRVPGEGIIMSAFNEGSRTWKNKTVHHHEYNTQKGTKFDLSDRFQPKTRSKRHDSNNNYLNDDLEDNLDVSVEIDSPVMLRDVGIQCNLKKYPKNPLVATYNIVTQKPPIKVIKSSVDGIVSTYSDVPKLGYTSSKIVDSRSKHANTDTNTDWNDNDAIYSQIDKSSKIRNNHSNSNLNIVYKQPLNDSTTSNERVYNVKSKKYGFSVGSAAGPKIPLPNPVYGEPLNRSYSSYKDFRDEPEKEIIEETISISNASTESKDSYKPHRSTPMNKYNDNLSYTGNSITSKSSQNFRGESPARLDRPNLPRYTPDSKGSKSRKKTTPQYNDENVLMENNSLRLKSSKSNPYSERLYKSNADLRDQYFRDETRGGLAAAYKNRQQNHNRTRALSLNRMNAIDGNQSVNSPPPHHLSQSQLGGSRYSDSGSPYHRSNTRLMQHERDPIVMYIPTVSDQRNAESPRLPGILRNNSTKSNVTLSSKSKKKEAKNLSKINKELNSKQAAKDKKKMDINRRHSMPKDTKFNWFSKFKIKK